MAQIFAFEWDAHEIRMVGANLRGNDVVLEQAASFPLAAGSDDLVIGQEVNESGITESLSEQLASILEQNNITRANALVAVPRSSVEVRVLQVPPVPDDELPDMVRWQALKHFSSMGDNWPLDFVRLASGVTEETERVLATAISPQLVTDLTKAFETQQVTASRLILRPFASGSLVQRALGDQLPACYLVVELLGKEADLTVMHENQVTFMRTIRLPHQAETGTQSRAVLGELKRTIAAAQNQTQGSAIERIVLCGDSELHQQIAELVPQELSIETSAVQPLEQVTLARSLASAPPEYPERFAALLGMLQDEADSGAHAINFLAPRKAPPPPNNKQRNIRVALACACCFVLMASAWWLTLNNLNGQIEDLKAESQRLEKFVVEGKEVQRELNEIAKFTTSQIIWLDELARVADTNKFPGPDKAIADSILMTAKSAGGGGSLVMPLHITEKASSNWGEVTRALRDPLHSVQDRGVKDDPRNRDYPVSRVQLINILNEPAKPKSTTARGTSRRSPSSTRN